MEENGSAAMLAAKRLADVGPEVNLPTLPLKPREDVPQKGFMSSKNCASLLAQFLCNTVVLVTWKVRSFFLLMDVLHRG